MTNYAQGRAFEYRVQANYKARGWVALRMAGSHSPLDIIAAKGGEIHVLQCKNGTGYLTPVQRKGLRAVAVEFGALPLIACKDSQGHIVIKRLEV